MEVYVSLLFRCPLKICPAIGNIFRGINQCNGATKCALARPRHQKYQETTEEICQKVLCLDSGTILSNCYCQPYTVSCNCCMSSDPMTSHICHSQVTSLSLRLKGHQCHHPLEWNCSLSLNCDQLNKRRTTFPLISSHQLPFSY